VATRVDPKERLFGQDNDTDPDPDGGSIQCTDAIADPTFPASFWKKKVNDPFSIKV